LNVGTHTWPIYPNPEQHWFRSDVSWSSDGKWVAIVDHQRRNRKGFFLEILDRKTGQRREYKLQWPDEVDEWPPDHDFDIKWTASQLVVSRGGAVQNLVR
jgi:hypothetical protein